MKIYFFKTLHNKLREDADSKGCSIAALVVSIISDYYNIKNI